MIVLLYECSKNIFLAKLIDQEDYISYKCVLAMNIKIR